MTHIYYIIIVLTALLSSLATLYYPTLKWRIRQYKTAIHKRNMMQYRVEVLETQMYELDKMIKQEVERQLKEILND